ncbi:MAG: helix-turn-helix domain-containing protein [Ktedonobacteraceae bacterium]
MNSETTQPLLLTVAQTSKVLNLGRTKIYELMKRGELPAVHVGKAVRFSYAALQQWVEQQTSKDDSPFTGEQSLAKDQVMREQTVGWSLPPESE